MTRPVVRGNRKSKTTNNKKLIIGVGVCIAVIALILILPTSNSGSSAAADSTELRSRVRTARQFFDNNEPKKAVEAYRQAVQLKKTSSAANLGLGIALEALAKTGTEDPMPLYHEAIEAYNIALQYGSTTEIPVAHNNVGNILRERIGNFTGALYHFKAAIETSSNVRMPVPFFYPYKNLGTLMEKNGYMEEAIANFEKAIEIERNDGLKVYARLLLPYVYKSEEDMHKWRRTYAENLDNLLNDDIKIDNPAFMEGVPQYYLSYHGQSNVELATKYAQLIRKACPTIDFVAPHVRTYKKPAKTIKIGFVSYYFRDHSVSKMVAGLLRRLRENNRFHVTLFSSAVRDDDTTKFLQMNVNEFVKIPVNDLGSMRNIIAMRQLDILVFAEIGMDPNNYALAHARLAPVQLAMHGHADTTGVPNIDYYVTYAGFDERSFSHYSERVLRVEGHTMLPLWYDMRPFVADKKLWADDERANLRRTYNIPEDAFVFACLQTLFKITPNMDATMREILQKNPKAVLLLKELPMTDKVGQFLLARLKNTMDEETLKRVIFLPPLNDNDYKNIFAAVDVILDSFPFGGHTSSMDAFSNNLPVVTLPTELLSGRCTLGFLHMLGADDLIAKNEQQFVAIATKLATDPDYLADVKRRLKQNWPSLIKDQTSVKSWEKMLVAVATNSNLHNFLV